MYFHRKESVFCARITPIDLGCPIVYHFNHQLCSFRRCSNTHHAILHRIGDLCCLRYLSSSAAPARRFAADHFYHHSGDICSAGTAAFPFAGLAGKCIFIAIFPPSSASNLAIAENANTTICLCTDCCLYTIAQPEMSIVYTSI